jgi:hypothetical protein
MACILATANEDLWATLGALVALIAALAWWDQRERAGTDDLLDGETAADFGLQDEGWQH